jgi:hypothetical protein
MSACCREICSIWQLVCCREICTICQLVCFREICSISQLVCCREICSIWQLVCLREINFVLCVSLFVVDYMVTKLKEDGLDNVHTEATQVQRLWKQFSSSTVYIFPLPRPFFFTTIWTSKIILSSASEITNKLKKSRLCKWILKFVIFLISVLISISCICLHI